VGFNFSSDLAGAYFGPACRQAKYAQYKLLTPVLFHKKTLAFHGYPSTSKNKSPIWL